MERIFAIVGLTWKAALRVRLFWVLAALLICAVVLLPIGLKHDGTARGFTQVLLTYTLIAVTTLLGFATLWLGCGTLARDIEDCQIQMVAVKPIARWQIWLGKWFGIVLLDAALLALAGGSIYGLMQWRANRLPDSEQRVLRKEIFVARASIKERLPDLEPLVEQVLQARLKETPVPLAEQGLVRDKIRDQIKAGIQVVRPLVPRRWTIPLGWRTALLRDEPLFIRFKFYAASTNDLGSYLGFWRVGPQDDPRSVRIPINTAAGSFHELQIPANLWDQSGDLVIDFVNASQTALLFPLNDGFELLYREGGYGLNFIRGLLVILCWLALLAALSLASASLLSFPVAAFFSVSVLIMALSSGTLSAAVSEGTVLGVDHETGLGAARGLDMVLLPLFRAILGVVQVVQRYSPIEALSTGRSITWAQLGIAWGQIVFLLGGFIALVGIVIFTRRELATPQGNT